MTDGQVARRTAEHRAMGRWKHEEGESKYTNLLVSESNELSVYAEEMGVSEARQSSYPSITYLCGHINNQYVPMHGRLKESLALGLLTLRVAQRCKRQRPPFPLGYEEPNSAFGVSLRDAFPR